MVMATHTVPCELDARHLCWFTCPFLPLFFRGEDTPVGTGTCEYRFTRSVQFLVRSINRQDRKRSGQLDLLQAEIEARRWLEYMARWGVLAHLDLKTLKKRLARHIKRTALDPCQSDVDMHRLVDRRGDPAIQLSLHEIVEEVSTKWAQTVKRYGDLNPEDQDLAICAFNEVLIILVQESVEENTSPRTLLQRRLEALGASAEVQKEVMRLLDTFLDVW